MPFYSANRNSRFSFIMKLHTAVKRSIYNQLARVKPCMDARCFTILYTIHCPRVCQSAMIMESNLAMTSAYAAEIHRILESYIVVLSMYRCYCLRIWFGNYTKQPHSFVQNLLNTSSSLNDVTDESVLCFNASGAETVMNWDIDWTSVAETGVSRDKWSRIT